MYRPYNRIMTLEEKLAIAKSELEALKKAYLNAIKAASWDSRDGDSRRSVTNQSLSTLSKEIDRKEAEIVYLESQIANHGYSGRAFRVGIVH